MGNDGDNDAQLIELGVASQATQGASFEILEAQQTFMRLPGISAD